MSWLQAARPFASKTDGKMGYEDFVYFILSEEDKTNNISLDYWFKCIDLDCDGSLRANEMLVSGLSHLSHTLHVGLRYGTLPPTTSTE